MLDLRSRPAERVDQGDVGVRTQRPTAECVRIADLQKTKLGEAVVEDEGASGVDSTIQGPGEEVGIALNLD